MIGFNQNKFSMKSVAMECLYPNCLNGRVSLLNIQTKKIDSYLVFGNVMIYVSVYIDSEGNFNNSFTENKNEIVDDALMVFVLSSKSFSGMSENDINMNIIQKNYNSFISEVLGNLDTYIPLYTSNTFPKMTSEMVAQSELSDSNLGNYSNRKFINIVSGKKISYENSNFMYCRVFTTFDENEKIVYKITNNLTWNSNDVMPDELGIMYEFAYPENVGPVIGKNAEPYTLSDEELNEHLEFAKNSFKNATEFEIILSVPIEQKEQIKANPNMSFGSNSGINPTSSMARAQTNNTQQTNKSAALSEDIINSAINVAFNDPNSVKHKILEFVNLIQTSVANYMANPNIVTRDVPNLYQIGSKNGTLSIGKSAANTAISFDVFPQADEIYTFPLRDDKNHGKFAFAVSGTGIKNTLGKIILNGPNDKTTITLAQKKAFVSALLRVTLQLIFEQLRNSGMSDQEITDKFNLNQGGTITPQNSNFTPSMQPKVHAFNSHVINSQSQQQSSNSFQSFNKTPKSLIEYPLDVLQDATVFKLENEFNSIITHVYSMNKMKVACEVNKTKSGEISFCNFDIELKYMNDRNISNEYGSKVMTAVFKQLAEKLFVTKTLIKLHIFEFIMDRETSYVAADLIINDTYLNQALEQINIDNVNLFDLDILNGDTHESAVKNILDSLVELLKIKEIVNTPVQQTRPSFASVSAMGNTSVGSVGNTPQKPSPFGAFLKKSTSENSVNQQSVSSSDNSGSKQNFGFAKAFNFGKASSVSSTPAASSTPASSSTPSFGRPAFGTKSPSVQSSSTPSFGRPAFGGSSGSNVNPFAKKHEAFSFGKSSATQPSSHPPTQPLSTPQIKPSPLNNSIISNSFASSKSQLTYNDEDENEDEYEGSEYENTDEDDDEDKNEEEF